MGFEKRLTNNQRLTRQLEAARHRKQVCTVRPHKQYQTNITQQTKATIEAEIRASLINNFIQQRTMTVTKEQKDAMWAERKAAKATREETFKRLHQEFLTCDKSQLMEKRVDLSVAIEDGKKLNLLHNKDSVHLYLTNEQVKILTMILNGRQDGEQLSINDVLPPAPEKDWKAVVVEIITQEQRYLSKKEIFELMKTKGYTKSYQSARKFI